MDFKGKIIVALIIGIICVSVIGFPSAIRRGKRSERQLELEARENLSTKTFEDFFDEFGVFTRRESYPFQYEYYDYLGNENNFTTIGHVSIIHSNIEGVFNLLIYLDTDDLVFRNISILLAHDIFDEPITSELSIMILGNGSISYYETDITENIITGFTVSQVTEISIVIF